MKHLKILVFSLAAAVAFVNCDNLDEEEKEASQLVNEINAKQIIQANKLTIEDWNYATNITKATEKKKRIAEEKYAVFVKDSAFELVRFTNIEFRNETLKRIIKKMTNIGDAILEASDYSKLKAAITKMQSNYASAKVPAFCNGSQLMSLEPEITKVFDSSRNPEELKYYWTKWHDMTGSPVKKNFFKYITLRNKASRKNNFHSGAEAWLDAYEDLTFEKQVEDILQQLKPLFLQLHGYVRHKLHEYYGAKHVDLKKPIPIHLLGNMWAQKWFVSDIVLPYRNKQSVDVTAEMLKQNFTPLKMFEMAENFFVSLNMTKLPETFWEKSVIEKPNDGRQMICHASAWDFSVGDDVRIKQCTRVTMESLVTVHHEMGHIEYDLYYRDQPFAFRGGANPGFHEAIGDVLALSVSTSRHLEKVGLLKDFVEDEETKINQIMRLGLEKLVFLPFAYVMDKFRYEIFRGNVKPEEANCYFWKLREQHSGLEPPIIRTNRDFDITAKYHASADVEYLRYFVSFIIQFQFHKAACIKAGEYEPNNPRKTLNDCDIYQSAEAGNALKAMLSMGSSKSWPKALEAMTGERQLNASDILEYFRPLEQWLLKTNEQLGVHIGWEPSDKIDCST